MDPEQVQIFVSITGASEDTARNRLQAHGGDLNAAINSFYNEGEPVHPVQSEEAELPQRMEEDEPLVRRPSAPLQAYPGHSTLAWAGGLPVAGAPHTWHTDDMHPGFPSRGTAPIVSHPRENWRGDGEPRVRSPAAILESENAHLPSQSPTDFVSDEDEVSGPASAVFRARGDRSHSDRIRSDSDYRFGNANLNAPLVSEVPAIAHNEGADIEEQMIRAAIEASQKETAGMTGLASRESQSGADMAEGAMHTEDEAMAWALSQSVKTAEEEKAMRRRLVHLGSSGEGFLQDDVENHFNPSSGRNYDQLNRKGSTSARDAAATGESVTYMDSALRPNFSLLDAPGANINSRDPLEDVDELEEPLLRRRSAGRRTFTPPIAEDAPTLLGAHQGLSHSTSVVAYPSSPPQRNGHARQSDEWGGLSSEEQDDAVMIEAAIFGSLPESVAARFHYPVISGGVVEDTDISDNGGLRSYARPAQLPPSPTVIAQRLLREQQDDEYLASLEADRQKEVRAQLEEESRRSKEEEARAAAHAEDKLRQEEELRKCLAAEELQKQIAAKRAALPEEPSLDDETAVTLMVKMPDGTRQGRRFRKSDHLQCLFDFIDVSGGLVPGSYRLVRQYPRKALTDGEHDSSFHALGLSSKHEALFLELV